MHLRNPDNICFVKIPVIRVKLKATVVTGKWLSIYYVIRDGGSSRFITILHRGGSPQFITILHGGGRQNLLQYYSFERKMEGYNPFSA